jgi:predicted metal-dependent phosphoesterase TrpH
MCTIPGLRGICRESYNDPAAVYEKLKRLGMDLVTITDHDSIDAVESLRSRPDFFLSEEVTCTLPSGNQLHVGVYDITERDHIELQRRRGDFESLLAWLVDNHLFFSANHVFSSLTGRRALADFALFETAFPTLETRNGHMLLRANANAAALADWAARAEVGGSDAHAMASVGCAWTTVPGARNRQEYLRGLRAGQGRVRGETGTWYKLTRDVLAIGRCMVHENPATAVIAALGWLVPFIILGNYTVEYVFARWWMARYMQYRESGQVPVPIAELAA